MARILTALSMTAALALCACGNGNSKPQPDNGPYTPKQLDWLNRQFEPFCMEPATTDVVYVDPDNKPDPSIRKCHQQPFIVYRLRDGTEIVGKVLSINRRTGALEVSWSGYKVEDFYPSSPRSVPGRLVRVQRQVLFDKDAYDLLPDSAKDRFWGQFNKEKGPTEALEKKYSSQPPTTMAH